MSEPVISTGVPPHLSHEQLVAAQDQTLATARPRYSIAARALFMLLDLIYGRKRGLAKFKVLEVIARVPYQAWDTSRTSRPPTSTCSWDWPSASTSASSRLAPSRTTNCGT